MPNYQLRIHPADQRYVAEEERETLHTRRVEAVKHLRDLARVAGHDIRASVYVQRYGHWHFSDNAIGRARAAA